MTESDNLVIGSTSQLSPYFPDDYVRISSRNIDFAKITSRRWQNIFICFAEQRTFIEDSSDIFFKVNFNYTVEVINKIKKFCEKIFFYSTTYLWNAYEGPVDLSMPYRYHITPYIESKEKISRYLSEHVKNAIVLYPCNFNSPYRKSGFLFSKIFDSIINKKQITIGETNFEKELAHPRYIVEKSLTAKNHSMIGPGYVINVNEFIRNLYNACGLEYGKYVTEKTEPGKFTKKPKSYHTHRDRIDYTKEDLLKDTSTELLKLTS